MAIETIQNIWPGVKEWYGGQRCRLPSGSGGAGIVSLAHTLLTADKSERATPMKRSVNVAVSVDSGANTKSPLNSRAIHTYLEWGRHDN